MNKLVYRFIVVDENGEEVFSTSKPTIEMLEEEIGRFERHLKQRFENE